MDSGDVLASRKIGYGSRDPEHPVISSCAEPHRFGSLGEQLSAGLVGRGYLVEEIAVGLCVGSHPLPFVAPGLDGTRLPDSLGHFGGTLGGRREDQIRRRHRLHVDVQVDSIQKRP